MASREHGHHRHGHGRAVTRVNSFHGSDVGSSDEDHGPVRTSGPSKAVARGRRGRQASVAAVRMAGDRWDRGSEKKMVRKRSVKALGRAGIAAERMTQPGVVGPDAVAIAVGPEASGGDNKGDNGGMEGPMQAFIQELARYDTLGGFPAAHFSPPRVCY